VVHTPEALMDGVSSQAEDRSSEASLIAQLPPAIRIPVEVMAYDPDELVLQFQAPADGWLWVTDRWARGWRATLNGRSVRVWGGNFIFRAVKVEAGPNELRFAYHPFGFPWLAVIGWGALCLVGLATLWTSSGRTWTLSGEASPRSRISA
jgi:hypothetical protein